jgi:hypothetical protein
MENGLANQDELDQVDNESTIAIKRKNELVKKQIDCLRSMILHHKKIPENWIVQNNYKNLLNKAMEDPTVLSSAVMSKNIYKKSSTSASIDIAEYEKNLQNSISSPKFISYINPYSRNYSDSIKKHRLMKDYCYSLKNKKNRVHKFIENQEKNEKNEKKEKDKKKYLNTDAQKDNILPYIFPGLKDIKKFNSRNKRKDDKLMMTSLHYDENSIYKDNKIKKDKEMNDNIDNENINTNDKNDNNKTKSIELPMIEL